MHYISRMDYRATHGYWVRIFNFGDGNGMTFQKLFCDLSHGGKRKALRKAKAWRDKKMEFLPDKPIRIIHEKISPRNTAGVIGVQLDRKVFKNGDEYFTYVASWYPEKDNKQRKYFPIDKYGEAEAFRLACEARAQGIEGIEKVRQKFKKAVKALQ